jgi:hypothetical protein
MAGYYMAGDSGTQFVMPKFDGIGGTTPPAAAPESRFQFEDYITGAPSSPGGDKQQQPKAAISYGSEAASAHLRLLDEIFASLDTDKSGSLSLAELNADGLSKPHSEAVQYARDQYDNLTTLAVKKLPGDLNDEAGKSFGIDRGWWRPAARAAQDLLRDDKQEGEISQKDVSVGRTILDKSEELDLKLRGTLAAEKRSGWGHAGKAVLGMAVGGLLFYLDRESGGTRRLLNIRSVTGLAAWTTSSAFDAAQAFEGKGTADLEREIAARRKWLSE